MPETGNSTRKLDKKSPFLFQYYLMGVLSDKNSNEEYFQSLLESLNQDPNWRVVEEYLEKYESIKKDLTQEQQVIISEMGRAMLALADSQPKIIIDKFLELVQNMNKK
ncbi:hypothetical protein [Nitrosopumilus piranensis]|uniref:Uncharacterized protein n=1 Tax=Nitrosopumilus piranensis TaxID=1582439 RepID=A0A0C5BZM8_9ARCH|nr:hypothetical protein [Nitrosopumilus piranensis]AJM92440.1 hypothetical protein NPIRD3C_1228 [Nitrosopumilus piranensis]